MDSLKNLIKGLYRHIDDREAILAETNLIGFFKKLESIEERLIQENAIESQTKEVTN